MVEFVREELRLVAARLVTPALRPLGEEAREGLDSMLRRRFS